MSYEACENYLKEYSSRSEIEKTAYKRFSYKMRSLIFFNENKEEDRIFKIFNLWYDMSENERDIWINETYKIDQYFLNVSTFLKMFEHNS